MRRPCYATCTHGILCGVNRSLPKGPRMTDHNPPVLDFTGKTVLVTGAAGGFGAAIARSFASAGANIVVVDRDGPGAQAVADKLPSALAVTADLTDAEQIRAM